MQANMQKVIECVPNFSEGSKQAVLSEIKQAIENTKDARLLNLEPDKDYNRSVFTIVGNMDSIVEAAFSATKVATELIDMSMHKGNHPRLGATDVVPFVPVANASMSDCIECANRYASMVASELSVPVYLYEEAALTSERKNLAYVRLGEYENLAKRILTTDGKPDYGEAVFNKKSGAVITGARKFLIAYNINLSTNDLTIAKEIAFTLRESGKLKRDESGQKVFDEHKKAIRVPGKLAYTKGLGVLLPEYNITQVSMNLTNYQITGMHTAYQACVLEAQKYGIEVTGSEVVGLIPKAALLESGRYYQQKIAADEMTDDDLLILAIKSLGLSDLHPFMLNKKVIEKMIA